MTKLVKLKVNWILFGKSNSTNQLLFESFTVFFINSSCFWCLISLLYLTLISMSVDLQDETEFVSVFRS